MNRTKAKPFNSEYEEAFPFLTKLPLTELRYEASFEWNQLLKYVDILLCTLLGGGLWGITVSVIYF